MAVLANGTAAEGTTWELDVSGDARTWAAAEHALTGPSRSR
jgi:hypothetical protein